MKGYCTKNSALFLNSRCHSGQCMLHALPLHTRLPRQCRDRYLRDSFSWGLRFKHSTEGTLPSRRLSDCFLQALDKIWAKIFKSDHDGSFPHTVGFSPSLGVLYKVTEAKHKTTWRVPNLDINYVPVTGFSNTFKEEWGAKLATERYVREERERERNRHTKLTKLEKGKRMQVKATDVENGRQRKWTEARGYKNKTKRKQEKERAEHSEQETINISTKIKENKGESKRKEQETQGTKSKRINNIKDNKDKQKHKL